MSVKTCQLPDEWKTVLITPIHEKLLSCRGDSWHLRLASEKCSVCRVCRRSEKRHQSHQYLTIKDLKPWTCSPHKRSWDLYWQQSHIYPSRQNNHTKSFTRARLLRLSFTSGDRTILAKAFRTYVRSLLEYCSPVWIAHLKYFVQGIESVQRFTGAIPSLRLGILNQQSL